MKRILVLMLSFSVLAHIHAGPDDQYLEIYSLIQQADGVINDSKTAIANYTQAQKGLKKLQSTYPFWQADVVKFRIDYVAEKLAAFENTHPQAASPVVPAEIPAVTREPTPQDQN